MATRIWEHKWIPGFMSPPVPKCPSHGQYEYVHELLDAQTGKWNINLLSTLFSSEETTRILTIRTNPLYSDETMWAHTIDGRFTIKSAYKVYMHDFSSIADSYFWKKVWVIDCLPKIKYFLWKFFAYMLPVNSVLLSYNNDIDPLCPLCHQFEETVMHLFIECSVAKHIWFGLSFQQLIQFDFPWIDDYFLYWHDSICGLSPYNVSWSSIGPLVLWCIWKTRCEVVFKNVTSDLDKVILEVKRMI